MVLAGIIIFIVVDTLLVITLTELRFIKKRKNCKHLCSLCEFADDCYKE